MSTDSYAVDAAAVIAGQRKAADDKKASRHADVIDTWDPTGLGSASESSAFLSSGATLTLGSVASVSDAQRDI